MSALLQHRPHRPSRSEDDLVSRLMSDGAYSSALQLLLPLVDAPGAAPHQLDQAATCYWELDQPERAMALLDRLILDWPDLGLPLVKLASYAASLGKKDRALGALDVAFARGVRSAQAFSLRHRLMPINRSSPLARQIKTIAQSERRADTERAIAWNTIARIEEADGRYRTAFHHFTKANKLWKSDYQPRQLSARVAAQILGFDPDHLPKDSPDMPRMVFITGMPRSGTTVLDHCLSRHPHVRPLGESSALSKVAAALRQTVQHGSAWDWCSSLDVQKLARLRQSFLARLPAGAGEDGRVLLFKMPFDCFDLGVAKALAPEARFVHMNRHPLDVGLSNYRTLFHAGHDYAQSLNAIAHIMRAVGRSVQDYQLKLGPDLRLQSYRQLVQQPERELRDILSHCGLAWSPDCLRPEIGGRPVRTASLRQIDAGLNLRDLDTWHPYAAFLEPLVTALGGHKEIDLWDQPHDARGATTQTSVAVA